MVCPSQLANETNRAAKEYFMINQFEIHNFRCFQHWKQGGLKRFNFIVGESGVGKTALLEALFIVGGANPEIWFRLRRWRGLGEGPMQINTRDNYESIFRDLFYQYKQSEVASVRIWDSYQGKRGLEIFYENEQVYTMPLQSDKGDKDRERENAFAINPIVFKWDLRDRVHRSLVEVKDGNIKMTGSAEIYPCVLISPRSHSSREYAQYYSNLSRTRKAGPVVLALQEIFPAIRGVSIEMVAGEPAILVDYEGIEELIAIGDLSGGLERYLSIVVSILTNRNGAILLDEIETGFYYRNMPSIMRGIVSLCDKANVQIFASTHNYELLKTMADAVGAAKGGASEFCVIRLEKGKTIQPDVTFIGGEDFASVLEQDFEIR
jgi:energy-coupling factor transporter ATP-binding protein EcfA2